MDDIHFKLLKLLADQPHITQRQLAKELDISLGKVNYCLKALIERGWVKVRNFTNNRNKRVYLYLLTPHGVEQKGQIAVAFLRRKLKEYEQLQQEIRQLRQEIEATDLSAKSES